MFLVNLTGCTDFSAAFLPWLLEGVHVLRNSTAISRVVLGSGGEENVFVLCKVFIWLPEFMQHPQCAGAIGKSYTASLWKFDVMVSLGGVIHCEMQDTLWGV